MFPLRRSDVCSFCVFILCLYLVSFVGTCLMHVLCCFFLCACNCFRLCRYFAFPVVLFFCVLPVYVSNGLFFSFSFVLSFVCLCLSLVFPLMVSLVVLL